MLTLKVATWIITAVLAVMILAQPVSTETQLTLSLTAIGVMVLLWRFGKGAIARQMFLATASFVVIRYLYWRLTSTLPPMSDPLGFALGVFLLMAEFYCVLILTISLTINADPLRRKPLEREEDDRLPTVDIFIPTYNEDEYILATTMAAARSMDYPAKKLTVWLLDDGGSDQKCNDKNPEKADAARQRRASLQALCMQMGCVYLTREKNQHAKAGNMNNGLRFAKGEIVVVFDADHAPFRNFLRETVGHFLNDPKLFLVQTPHIFLNPDPIEKNLRTFDRMPSENEMFYSVTQRGLDKWNGSFFCGSAALLRRSALDTVGGFSGITITEDCETALDLHSQGWTSVFVEKPLIAGLQPETFSSFIGQRSRWCQGMFQILLLKNPLLKKGLHPVQKLAYLSSMTFWFFPLSRLTFMVAPLVYIFFDIKIFVSNLDEAVAYTACYIVVNLMLQNYMYGRVRWPWMSELYEYLQGVFLSKAIVSVVANPKKPTFNVTAKGISLDNDHLSELAWPFFAIYGLLFVGGLVALWRYLYDPSVSDLMLVVGLLNLFNMILAGAALGAVAERKQPDRHPRLTIARTGRLTIGDTVLPVKCVDVSAGGVGIQFDGDAPEIAFGETKARLAIDNMGTMMRDETLPLVFRHRTTKGDRVTYGTEFEQLDPREYYALADLMYADNSALERFLASRRNHKDVFSGTWQVIYWGLTEPIRAILYALKKNPQAEQAAPGPAPIPVVSTHWLRVLLRAGRRGEAEQPAIVAAAAAAGPPAAAPAKVA
jgi:cellulose synthase (UDP-forming)